MIQGMTSDTYSVFEKIKKYVAESKAKKNNLPQELP